MKIIHLKKIFIQVKNGFSPRANGQSMTTMLLSFIARLNDNDIIQPGDAIVIAC